jgi:hypothetical protein
VPTLPLVIMKYTGTTLGVVGLYNLNPVDPQAWKRPVSTLEPLMWWYTRGILVSSLCFSNSSTCIRYSVAQVVFLRFFFATLTMLPVMLASAGRCTLNQVDP